MMKRNSIRLILGRCLSSITLLCLTTTLSIAQTVQIVIETRIKKKTASFQAGMKSRQFLTINYEQKTVTSRFETGITHIGPAELHSIRDKFTVSNIQFAGKVASFKAQGETASGVFLMPNINYKFDITVDNKSKEIVYSGCHDGYPSYSIATDNKQLYTFEQEFLTALFGSCDTVVPSTTKTF